MSAASGRLILIVDHYALLTTKKSFPEDVYRGRNWWLNCLGNWHGLVLVREREEGNPVYTIKDGRYRFQFL